MSESYHGITREEFESGRNIRLGKNNPEIMANLFWEKMAKCRADPFWVQKHFGDKIDFRQPRPVWTFDRMGQSATILPYNCGLVHIGGEHEDSYDPNFAIYNDVIVKLFDGTIEIYGYPREVFQPTDFHTATLVDDQIYIIGGLCYTEDRVLGTTPIYQLDIESKHIQRIEVKGREPGWLYMHEALYWKDEHAILVWGGKLMTDDTADVMNTQMWALDLDQLTWRPLDSVTLVKSSSPWIFGA